MMDPNLRPTYLKPTGLILAIVGLLALVVWVSPLHAADWQSLGRGTNRATGGGMEYFIDMASVRRKGDNITFVEKAIYDRDQRTVKGVKFRSIVVTVYMDCRHRKAADVAQTYFDLYGREVHDWADFSWIFAGSPMPESFTSVLSGSFEDTARKRLCP